MESFGAWENFNVIVGSSAGALIGLQFVAVTLSRPRPRMEELGKAFATPTIVHFTTVLFLAALLSAPWSEVITPATVWGLVGAGGMIFSARIILHVRRQDSYRPVLEDWLFHVVLPVLSYVGLLVSAVCASTHLRGSLFAVGGTMLLLLFIGIHNTWDTVTYHVFSQGETRGAEEFTKAS